MEGSVVNTRRRAGAGSVAEDAFRRPTLPPAKRAAIPQRPTGVRKEHCRSERGRTHSQTAKKAPQEIDWIASESQTRTERSRSRFEANSENSPREDEKVTRPQQARVPTVTETLLAWEERTQNPLEACPLRGLTKGIFGSFDCHTCDPNVFCQREDNFIKRLQSKAHKRKLFAIKPLDCKTCPGFKSPFRNFLEVHAHESSASHLA